MNSQIQNGNLITVNVAGNAKLVFSPHFFIAAYAQKRWVLHEVILLNDIYRRRSTHITKYSRPDSECI